jgi:glutamate synthase (NADPH/NADH) small chain
MSHMDRTSHEELARRELARIRSIPLNPKARMQIPVQDMPSQDPSLRRANMSEVASGYTAEQAMLESERCLQCKSPCVTGCPQNHIPRLARPKEISPRRFGDQTDQPSASICAGLPPGKHVTALYIGKALGGRDKRCRSAGSSGMWADVRSQLACSHTPPRGGSHGKKVAA